MSNGLNRLRQFGDCVLDPEKLVLWHHGEPVELQPKEVELLSALTEAPGQVVTKRELMDRIWPDAAVEESNLTQHVYRLRNTLSALGEPRTIIQTVPRCGYRFTGKVSGCESNGVVIESHTLTRTLIEEIHDSAESAIEVPVTRKPTTATVSLGRGYGRAPIIAIGLLVLFAGALAIYTIQTGRSVASYPINSLAVLPFNSLDRSDENRYRGLALADLLIMRLSNVRELSVRPTSAVMAFEHGQAPLDEIRSKLDVDAVVEGTILEAGDKLRITARLVRLADSSTVWAQEFSRIRSEESEMQEEIVLQIAHALAVNLSGENKRPLTKRYSESDDAWQLYLKGRYHWNKRSNEGIVEAQRLFRNAVDKDPNFALAYVGIADTLIFAPTVGEAVTAVEKAISLDPDLAEAYATRGFINMLHSWAWDSAESDFKRAIDLNPGYATAHQWYATLLMIKRRPAEAQSKLRDALRIDPLSFNLYSDLCQAQYYAKDFDAAELSCRHALELFPDFQYAHMHLSNVYFAASRHEDAVRQRALGLFALSKHPSRTKENEEQAKASAEELISAVNQGGVKGYWKFVLERTEMPINEPNEFIERARAFLELGDRDKAIENLSLAIDRHAFLAPFVNADPVFDPLRSDQRFEQFILKLGLV